MTDIESAWLDIPARVTLRLGLQDRTRVAALRKSGWSGKPEPISGVLLRALALASDSDRRQTGQTDSSKRLTRAGVRHSTRSRRKAR